MAAGPCNERAPLHGRPRRHARADRHGRGEEPRALGAQPLRAVPARDQARRGARRAARRRSAGSAGLQPHQRRRRRRGGLQPGAASNAWASLRRARRCAPSGWSAERCAPACTTSTRRTSPPRRRTGLCDWPASSRATSTSWRCTTASPSPRSCAWKGSASSRAAKGGVDRGRTHVDRRRAARQSQRRPAVARPSGRRDRHGAGVRAVLATDRPGRQAPGRRRQACARPTARAAPSAEPTARR